MINDLSKMQYAARVWRRQTLQEEAGKEVEKMLRAFLPKGWTIDITEGEYPIPGLSFAATDRFSGIFHDPRHDDPTTDFKCSDAHFFATAKTREGVYAKLLAIILENSAPFPMT